MLSKPRKDLKDIRERVLSMVSHWNRETVYEVLNDYLHCPLEEADHKGKINTDIKIRMKDAKENIVIEPTNKIALKSEG